MTGLIEIVVMLLFVARVTRLIVADEITRRPREAIVRRLPDGSPLAYLLFCRWCLSVWIATPAAAAWWLLSDVPRWSRLWWADVPTVALALSYATGLLVRAEPEE
ncbi:MULTISPECIES: hypothetical protein [Micromonospora]|uniref:DUF1360 domain-containing protein n=1 Tax=Micromonospora solifontis TaxID=2487138 RepID=A0ABX9WKS2_9ACTN|nr:MULTISPECIES: hypothetical protein [Micromonospora]NES14584.1 hypothetical protein [Micromonospora sp. PPF5-17B]NES35278.1 hypothetical protein [Micromonospora solifontis]RNM01006.1 hypothetical protein EFE23_03760 [Micromonospora solifontis]